MMCVMIMTMNNRAVHSWISIRTCLNPTRNPLVAPYPLGNITQFIRPVTLNRMKRINDTTLIIQSFKALLFAIYLLLPLK